MFRGTIHPVIRAQGGTHRPQLASHCRAAPSQSTPAPTRPRLRTQYQDCRLIKPNRFNVSPLDGREGVQEGVQEGESTGGREYRREELKEGVQEEGGSTGGEGARSERASEHRHPSFELSAWLILSVLPLLSPTIIRYS